MKTIKKNISTKKENGSFYTPNYIVENILNLSGYEGNNILKKHVIDNSCGDGAFLTVIVKRYCEIAVSCGYSIEELKFDLSHYVHGIEIDNEERKKCVINVSMIAEFYGIRDISWDIVCANTMLVNNYDGKMDFVLGNPPYVRIHNLGDFSSNIRDYFFSQDGMTDLYIVFYELGIRMLNDSGTLGYITPNSFFNSLAGFRMRKYFVENNLIDKIVNLKHFQPFNATTYTAIVILKKNRKVKGTEYYSFDNNKFYANYIETLYSDDYYISNCFYFAEKNELIFLKKIYNNNIDSFISVKNGYATLCDKVFVHDFPFESKFIIPVIKSSKGILTKILYPYDCDGNPIPLDLIQNDVEVYRYLLNNKTELLQRSNENDNKKYWYLFGRSQALNDTYRDKLSVNTLIRTENDLKLVDAPAGVGVYSGLYIITKTISISAIKKVLNSKMFVSYIYLLGKYKSGGYYTYSSKDVKKFLDYIFSFNGGSTKCQTMTLF